MHYFWGNYNDLMDTAERIESFVKLGERILVESQSGSGSAFEAVVEQAHHHNPWFTPDNVRYAVHSIATLWLKRATLEQWLSSYPAKMLEPKEPKRVGVIMAGNIPFVGFHDLLCVLISGHRFLGKFSSKDGGLMNAITTMLCEIDNRFSATIEITERTLTGFDMVIATGSNNSARYFDYYFRSYPTIIRKHRNSVAVLTGEESDRELMGLGHDIFTYFGLGCRNVSQLLIPVGYNLPHLLDNLSEWRSLINHHKYANNYEYNRALLIMNQVKHLDTGFLLVTPNDSIGSPVGVLHYQEYPRLSSALAFVESRADEIQCLASGSPCVAGSIPFGSTQRPTVDEYADAIDTIRFLAGG